MTKEYLETLEKLKEHLKYEWIDNLSNTEYYDILEQALQRLEAIDNAKPSKAMDRLEYICKILNEKRIDIKWLFKNDYNTIKQALLKAQNQEKELEVLQILKTKQVDINFFKTLIPYNKTIEKLQSAYNISFVQWAKLTLDETKIIKEWLEDDI